MTRWLGEPGFEAALNQGLRTARQEAERRLAQMATKAVTVVEHALDADDTKVAVALLRGLGLLCGSAPPLGPDAPEQVVSLEHLTTQQLEELERILTAADAEGVEVTAPVPGSGSDPTKTGGRPTLATS